MKPKTQTIVTRQVALNIISLVDYCYRKGVEDAYRLQDEGLAREFIGKSAEVGVYGFLCEDSYTMTWKEWTLRLMAQSRITAWNGHMVRYFSMLGNYINQNYLGCFVPISQRFYVDGVKDYTDAPHGCDFDAFKDKSRVRWTAKGLQNLNIRRYVDEIQLCAFDLQRRDRAIWEDDKYYAKRIGAMTPKQYEFFIRTIGLALINSKY